MKPASVRSASRSLALALLFVSAPCRAQQQGAEAQLQLQDATTVDAILELSRAAKVNVLADTTDLPAAPAPISGEWHGKLRDWQASFGRASALGTHRPDESTLLCWVKPDLSALAQQVGAEARRKATEAAEAEAANPGGFGFGFVLPAPPAHQDTGLARDWTLRLVEELRARGWGQGEPAAWRPVVVAELPLALRLEVVRHIQDGLLSPQQMPMHFWLDEEFWGRARLKVSTMANGKRILMLGGSTVSSQNSRGELFTGLALLDQEQR